jgi:transcription initiation factor IIE alpha subunit
MQEDMRVLRLLLPSAVARIMKMLPQDMSGSMKAQHIGVYCVILSMHLNEVLVTRRSICDILGMADTHVGPKVKKLLELNVITSRKSRSPYGNRPRSIFEPVMNPGKITEVIGGRKQHLSDSSANPEPRD